MNKLKKADVDDDIILKYRKRIIRKKDIIDINNLIQKHPDASRRRLSALLCELWDWRHWLHQSNWRASQVFVSFE